MYSMHATACLSIPCPYLRTSPLLLWVWWDAWLELAPLDTADLERLLLLTWRLEAMEGQRVGYLQCVCMCVCVRVCV